MRRRIIAVLLITSLLLMYILPMSVFAAPKEGDYVDPVEYYDLAQFAGMQLTSQGDIRKAILDKEYLPVELVLKPLTVSTSVIRLAHGNAGDFSPLENYTVFQGEPWVIKHNEKSSYTVVHETGNAGAHRQAPDRVFGSDYNYQWQASVNLTFDDVIYYVGENNWAGKFFNMDYHSAGSASSSASQEYVDPETNRNGTYTFKYTFEDKEEKEKINWYVDDTGIMKLWLDTTTTTDGIFEEWRYENPDEVLRESMDLISATVYFQVEQVKLGKADSVSSGSAGTVNTRADRDKGETSVSIPEAIAIAIIGGAAAMAGAGIGGSGGDGGNNNSKKRSRYKMCLRKDFGDAIRYDTQPVTVYARIVEVTPEGEEIDRPDLTSAIRIFSGGNLTVEDCSVAGNYMGALVSAKSASGRENHNSGVVSIHFSGEEGSFQNNVTFRLIGKPYIAFPEQGRYLTMTLPMLLGDGKLYETPIILHDFMEKPTSVKLDVANGVPLRCELEEIEGVEGIEGIEDAAGANIQSYMLKIKNISAKPEGQQALKQTFGIGIIVENEKEKAENSLNAELYPEGLSIREVKLDDDGYVIIDTFDNKATEEWGDVNPTGFVLDFAVAEQEEDGRPKVRVLEPKEYNPVFGGLKGTDERTSNLAERFKYSIQEIPSNLKEYKFTPQEALVEEKDKPYYLTLPISCTYGKDEYTLELPIRLLGGGPGPLAGWDEAFANMKKVVSKVGGISPELAKLLRENGKKMSTAELRLVTYRICHDAVVYYTQDAAEYEKIAAELDSMLYYAEWLKWFGDQAFSYLISTYYGNTADAILSPAKDIFTSFLGEVIGQLVYGEQIDWESLEVINNINNALDNLITNFFDDSVGKKGVSVKQISAVVGGFLVWKIAKNIYDNIDNEGKVDLYSAITATVSDLTAMGMKKIAGNFFDKALKSKAVQKNLNTPLGKWLQDLVPDTSLVKWFKDDKGKDAFNMINFNKADIFKKYLEDIFGMGMVKVTEIDMQAIKGFQELTSGSSITSTLDLSAWPQIDWVTVTTTADGQEQVYRISVSIGTEALGKFYDYLFEALFGDVPFAAVVKPPPVDPPYFPVVQA